MKILVRLSYGLAQRAGKSRITITLEEGSTVDDLLGHLKIMYPELMEQLATSVAVISGKHVTSDEELRSDDEVSILIPISGG